MNVLIVHAHHEPKSFCSALARRAEQTLIGQGYSVEFVDLYAEKFNPVSGRHNFTTVKDPYYFKQQAEETHATETGGFSPEIERELRRLEACDLLIFAFPLWWFGMPAILKGWVDRVFAYGRVYGGPNIYETGLGKSRKRGLVIMTTGGGPDVYGGYGVNPPLSTILSPVQHGVFWFNGILPLAPFVAWSPARISPEDREQYLNTLSVRLAHVGTEAPQVLPPLTDFPGWGKDTKKRFMVTVSRGKPADNRFNSLVPAEGAQIAELKREGIVLSFTMTPADAPDWRGFLHLRANSISEVNSTLSKLPLADYLSFEIRELAQI